MQNQSQTGSSAPLPSRGQVAIILVCSILVATMVATITTALPFGTAGRSLAVYLLVPLSPGLFFAALIQPLLTHKEMFDFRAIYIAFFANLVYWFLLIFGFALWSDLRWRRKRAARIDA